MFEIYRGLMADPRFVDNYRFVALDVPDTDDRICTYASREWLSRLQASGDFGIELID